MCWTSSSFVPPDAWLYQIWWINGTWEVPPSSAHRPQNTVTQKTSGPFSRDPRNLLLTLLVDPDTEHLKNSHIQDVVWAGPSWSQSVGPGDRWGWPDPTPGGPGSSEALIKSSWTLFGSEWAASWKKRYRHFVPVPVSFSLSIYDHLKIKRTVNLMNKFIHCFTFCSSTFLYLRRVSSLFST